MKILNKFKYIVSLMLILTMLLTATVKVEAASFTATASSSTVSPNATFKVTIKATGCVGRVNVTVTNGTISGDTSFWLEDGSATVTVKAGSSGTTKVTATPQEGFSDLDGNKYSPGAKTVSVTIKAASSGTTTPTVTKSSDNKLSSLKVNEGPLSPAFSSGTTEYTVNVGATVSKITLSATAPIKNPRPTIRIPLQSWSVPILCAVTDWKMPLAF